MRKGQAVTAYLDEEALRSLDEAVAKRAAADRENGLTGYAVTTRSKLLSEIIVDYLAEERDGELTITEIQRIVRPIFDRYGVRRAELFGSYARGEQGPDSDVDMIIEKGAVRGLQFFKLQEELSQRLGKKVNLQAKGSDEAFERKIDAETVLLYAV